MCLSPKEIIDQYIVTTKKKNEYSAIKIFGKAILAGMMIGMGAAGSSVAAYCIDSVGVARLLAALVFPVGLMMVILLGAELFTGDCLMAVAFLDKQMSFGQLVKMLILVYLGNFLGAIIFSGLVFLSGQFDYSGGLLGAYTIKVATSKASISMVSGLTSGICCNILVCAAVLMTLATKEVAGKLLASFFVIMLFVTSGFEHCVANMYYITAGLMAKLNPIYVEMAMSQYGLSDININRLDIEHMLFHNLLPVTIGNVVGGVAFVGIPLYLLTREVPAQKKSKVTVRATTTKKVG